MKSRSQIIRQFILENIERHPGDIVAVTSAEFKLTRPAIHRHLTKLIERGLVAKVGHRRATRYFLASEDNKSWVIPVTPELAEDEIWEKYMQPLFKSQKENVDAICHYGFTEMFNNVVSHSGASTVQLGFKIKDGNIILTVFDDGIGVFKKIKDYLQLDDLRESVLHLVKGKFTTDPEEHSGEGIFFTSRMFDEFAIFSRNLMFMRQNREEEDWFVESRETYEKKGTTVQLTINMNSDRTVGEIFKKYTDPETFAFDKTRALVQLAQMENEKYISRSQAKRLLFGLEKFKRIVLDCKQVTTVGQSFVDEVFRVFQNKHPQVKITYCNANEDVDFMIRRGLETAAINKPEL
ncbi:MAG: STAS-like domain-containing protein [Nitrospinales bacterium]